MKTDLKISIVTPSFNQGMFIEETILSVVGQGYPNLEYIIIDGGSIDNTVDVIKKYESQIDYWVSEPDKGQAHAINKGFEKATGDIVGWLNSDDMYMPGTLKYITQKINPSNEGIYFGNCLHFKEDENGVNTYGSNVVYSFNTSNLETVDYVIQPSTFWNKKTWKYVGNLNEEMHYAFDWEWFLRAKQKNVPMHPVEKCLSIYRIHTEHKTGTGGVKRQQEILSIYKEYDERMGRLYETLMHEKRANMTKLNMRVLRKLMHAFCGAGNESDLLKLFHAKKYMDYTSKEISECLAML